MMNLKNLARRFRKDERGVTLVEYGIGIVLAVTIGVAALGDLATDIDATMQGAENQLEAVCAETGVDCT